MVYLVIVLGGSYLVFILWMMIGWRRALSAPTTPTHVTPLLTVIVAARNEAQTLPLLLADLATQTYPAFEVLVMDDHSEDDTYAVAASHRRADGRIRVVRCEHTGKKLAITQAIALAQGSIMVTTDADCRVPPAWLATMAAVFQHAPVQFAVGGVRMASRNFFSALQSIEFASLIGAAGATVAAGIPTLCNGANMAYRKNVFEEVGGYEGNVHIASGDDEFLMRKVWQRYPRGIRFIADAPSVVTTLPAETLRAFVQQRLRWAGKWRYNTSVAARLLAVYILAVQALCLVCTALLFTGPTALAIPAAALLLSRAALEAGFLASVCRFLRVPWNWLAFIVLQAIYPVYVLVTGLLSLGVRTRWKGRGV